MGRGYFSGGVLGKERIISSCDSYDSLRKEDALAALSQMACLKDKDKRNGPPITRRELLQ